MIDASCTIKKRHATPMAKIRILCPHSIRWPKIVPSTAEGRERTTSAYVWDWNVIGDSHVSSTSSRLTGGGTCPRRDFRNGSGFDPLPHSANNTSPKFGATLESSSGDKAVPDLPAERRSSSVFTT